MLVWPSGCSDRQGSIPPRPPGRIHRAAPAPLPVTGSGTYVSESGQLTRQDLCGRLPSLTCWIAALSAALDTILPPLSVHVPGHMAFFSGFSTIPPNERFKPFHPQDWFHTKKTPRNRWVYTLMEVLLLALE